MHHLRTFTWPLTLRLLGTPRVHRVFGVLKAFGERPWSTPTNRFGARRRYGPAVQFPASPPCGVLPASGPLQECGLRPVFGVPALPLPTPTPISLFTKADQLLAALLQLGPISTGSADWMSFDASFRRLTLLLDRIIMVGI